jgi:uncharacterized protein (UPF0297 family)
MTFSNLYKHLRIKKICPVEYLNIERKLIRTEYNNYLDMFLERRKVLTTKKILNGIDSPDFYISKHSKNGKYVCSHCEKKFKYRGNCLRHIEKGCQALIDKEEKDKELMEELLKSKIHLLELGYEDKLNREKEEREKLEEKIKLLQEQLNNGLSTTNNNNQVNVAGNAGQVADSITNNFTINNYGQEDLSSIDKAVFERIAGKGYTMIQDMIDYIHIETECNRNIYIPSHKEKYAMILQDDEWNMIDKKELIDNLVFDKRQMLHKLLDIYKDELETISAKRTQSILEYCESEIGEMLKIKSDVLTKLLNNRDDIRFTFETNRNKKVAYTRKKII